MFSKKQRSPGSRWSGLVAQHDAGVGAGGLRADQGGHVDDPLPSPPRGILQQRVPLRETASSRWEVKRLVIRIPLFSAWRRSP